MIAAAAASQLLIGKIDRAMWRAKMLCVSAGRRDGVGVCRSRGADKVQLAGENSAGEFGFESREIEH
jgi:hypothetical protein